MWLASKALDKKIAEGWDDKAAHIKAIPDLQENSMRFRVGTLYAKGDRTALGLPPAKLGEQLARENTRFSRAQGVPWPYNTDGPWIYRCVLPQAFHA